MTELTDPVALIFFVVLFCFLQVGFVLVMWYSYSRDIKKAIKVLRTFEEFNERLSHVDIQSQINPPV